MSTNFYIKTHSEQNEDEAIHIGKRSCGWQFILNPHRKSGKAWINLLNKNKHNIYDEYNRNVTISDMLNNISLNGSFGKDKHTGKTVSGDRYNGNWKEHEFFDKEGYRICKRPEFS